MTILVVMMNCTVLKRTLISSPNLGKKSWLRKLKSIFNPDTTDVREPRVQNKTRGRPKKSQQKKRADFCSTRYSCSTMPDFVKSIIEPARHSSFEFDLNKEVPDDIPDLNEIPDDIPDLNEIPDDIPDLNEVPDDIPDEYQNFMDDIPGVFHSTETQNPDPYMYRAEPDTPDPYMYTTQPYIIDPGLNNAYYLTGQGLKDFLPYITQVQDVQGDGNCGFRAVAVCLGLHQENWTQIRTDLLDELSMHNATYSEIFLKQGVQSLQFNLNYFDRGFAPTPHWMIMPDTGLIIASRYNVVVIFLSANGDSTCFPLFTSPPRSHSHKICVIARFNGVHYVRLVLDGDFPIPPTHPQWSRYAFDRTWENAYLHRQNVYNQIKFPRRNSVGVKTCIDIDD